MITGTVWDVKLTNVDNIISGAGHLGDGVMILVNEGTIIDLLETPRTGENANHFCLVVEPADFDAIKASGRYEVVDGPDVRWGARGDATSLYIRDPDGNVVELRYY